MFQQLLVWSLDVTRLQLGRRSTKTFDRGCQKSVPVALYGPRKKTWVLGFCGVEGGSQSDRKPILNLSIRSPYEGSVKGFGVFQVPCSAQRAEDWRTPRWSKPKDGRPNGEATNPGSRSHEVLLTKSRSSWGDRSSSRFLVVEKDVKEDSPRILAFLQTKEEMFTIWEFI